MEIWSQPGVSEVGNWGLVYESNFVLCFLNSQSKGLHAGKFHIKSHRQGKGSRTDYLFARTKYKAFVFG